MLPLKIGISLGSLRQPLRKALVTAARLGATAVEIDARGEFRPSEMTGTAVRQVRKLLNDLNLRVCAVNFQTRRGYNESDQLDRRIAATKDALRMAYELNAPIVVNRIGRVPAEPEGPSWDLLTTALNDLALHCDRVGAILAARTGSEDGADLARLLATLDTDSIGVDFDPAGLIINGFSPLESLTAVGRSVRHVRARDGVRDLAQGRGLETPLGRGTVDFPAMIGMLEDFGYRGALTVDRQHADNPIQEIGNAVQFLTNIQ